MQIAQACDHGQNSGRLFSSQINSLIQKWSELERTLSYDRVQPEPCATALAEQLSAQHDFQQYIRFLEEHSDDAADRFQQFTQKRLVIICNNDFADPIEFCAREYGLQNNTMIYRRENMTSSFIDNLPSLDAIVYADTQLDRDILHALLHNCMRHATPLYPAWVAEKYSYIGPAQMSHSEACINCLLLELDDSSVKPEGISDNLLLIMAHFLFFGIFKDLTQLPQHDYLNQVTIIENQDLSVSRQLLDANPECQFCQI